MENQLALSQLSTSGLIADELSFSIFFELNGYYFSIKTVLNIVLLILYRFLMQGLIRGDGYKYLYPNEPSYVVTLS